MRQIDEVNWLVNPKAIKLALKCINTIQHESGVRLKLSQPKFLETLRRHVEIINSAALTRQYTTLMSFAQAEQMFPTKVAATANHGVQPMLVAEDQIEYNGKLYPKSHQGKKFKGLYRGRPHYA